jgi:hypothetical protein
MPFAQMAYSKMHLGRISCFGLAVTGNVAEFGKVSVFLAATGENEGFGSCKWLQMEANSVTGGRKGPLEVNNLPPHFNSAMSRKNLHLPLHEAGT